jgi:hypothetical protein
MKYCATFPGLGTTAAMQSCNSIYAISINQYSTYGRRIRAMTQLMINDLEMDLDLDREALEGI